MIRVDFLRRRPSPLLLANLALALVLFVATSLMHLVGLVGLSVLLRRRGVHPANLTTMTGQGLSIVFIVVLLFLLHAAQIWLYALVYLALGEFQDVESALYFSTSTFTTVGFGDVYLDRPWRMLSAAESANGFLLIGWSTAFLVSVSARVRAFQAEIFEAIDPDD